MCHTIFEREPKGLKALIIELVFTTSSPESKRLALRVYDGYSFG